MKKFLIAGGVLLLLILGGVFLVYSNLDAIVKAAIERVGTEVTQVHVSVDRVQLKLTEGKGIIQGVKVGNPGGYEQDHSFTLGEIRLGIDPQSITQDVIRITEIYIDAPSIFYELKGTDSNLQHIQRNTERFSNSRSTSSASSNSSKGSKKIQVDELVFQNAKVAGSAELLGHSKKIDLNIPSIRMSNLGNNGGLTPSELAAQVVKRLTHEVVSAAKTKLGLDGNALKEKAKSEMKKMIQEHQGQIQGDVQKKLKGLFQ